MNLLKVTLILLFAMGALPMLGMGMQNPGIELATFGVTALWGGFLYLLWRV